MNTPRLLAISTSILCLLTLPALAGPCSADIERMQFSIDAKLNAKAAESSGTGQSTAAQLHRQPTPGSIAETEVKLGVLSPDIVEKVKAAMTRARDADRAGDKTACEQALDDVRKIAAQ